MLDGYALVDVHLHPVRLSAAKVPWDTWVYPFDSLELRALYGDHDTVDPVAFDQYLAREGVDVAIALAEYSPKVTGFQTVEEVATIAQANPSRIKFAANVNPHLHYPVHEELERQVALGAVALKVHPVHGGFAVNDRALYPAYEICQGAGLPVVIHSGTSNFSGAMNRYGDPALIDDLLHDFPSLDIVLAHGGRGWWYDAAASLALLNEHVWIELSGLPPSRLLSYYSRHSWARLSRRMIFATDWPGVPGIAENARAVAALCTDEETTELVLSGNACAVYNLKIPRLRSVAGIPCRLLAEGHDAPGGRRSAHGLNHLDDPTPPPTVMEGGGAVCQGAVQLVERVSEIASRPHERHLDDAVLAVHHDTGRRLQQISALTAKEGPAANRREPRPGAGIAVLDFVDPTGAHIALGGAAQRPQPLAGTRTLVVAVLTDAVVQLCGREVAVAIEHHGGDGAVRKRYQGRVVAIGLRPLRVATARGVDGRGLGSD
jgi:predicted TIM-barrel fold metal-dependent hydrolase